MDAVLDGKLDVIAYLPYKTIRERICGMKSYSWEQLKEITEFHYNDADISDAKKEEL